jgi:hypothetical protein
VKNKIYESTTTPMRNALRVTAHSETVERMMQQHIKHEKEKDKTSSN